MPYVSRTDMVSAIQVADDSKVIIHGTVQTARTGEWVVVKAATGAISIFDDEAFKQNFLEVTT